ncbi:hypothetical protein D1AOALGA4SA_5554 [Olavius algarvensis Delta 1 endosymbiont]|nr:hypothetical protein D1AOALGA4SA_5554 [Olavius algarvensis Delta 1 endosymbiont]
MSKHDEISINRHQYPVPNTQYRTLQSLNPSIPQSLNS